MNQSCRKALLTLARNWATPKQKLAALLPLSPKETIEVGDSYERLKKMPADQQKWVLKLLED